MDWVEITRRGAESMRTMERLRVLAQERGGSLGTVELDMDHYRAVWGVDDDERATAEWFCLRVKPWRCDGCGTQFQHAMYGGKKGEHLVVVWPTRDDPNMRNWMTEHFEGKAAIVPFEESIGPAVSYYAIERS